MSQWTILGIFLIGAGAGALLTYIVQVGRRAKAKIQTDDLPKRHSIAAQWDVHNLRHDLNNGLGIISGHAQLMIEHAGPYSECAERSRLILNAVNGLAKRIGNKGAGAGA
jgi:nitrogen-specific signal transduction histidine kinase